MTSRRKMLLFACLIGIVFSCRKTNNSNSGLVVAPGFNLSYGDSVFYLQNQASDYIISPTEASAGQYSGFPEGIEIDTKTGAINVSKSETGLRYRITFKPAGSTDSLSTVILISGINFLDGFYRLTTADSIARPLYNANSTTTIPGVNNGSIFDEGSNCNVAGCNVDESIGTINLAQTVRNGVFGSVPSNNDRHEFQMNYRINDKSKKALNTLRIKIYYFDSINDVTQEVYDIISSRQGTILGSISSNMSVVTTNSLNKTTGVNKPAKPRPPCIFILAR